MDFHPVANIFPLLQGDEYEQLKADIAKNGLLEPIWLHPDGRIIDGRNRWRACVDTNTNAKTRLYGGDTSTSALVSFVVSYNLKRRQLNSSQLAFVALEIEKILAEAAKERQRQQALINQPQAQNVELIPHSEKGKAREQAAAIVGTNGRYVQDAKKLSKESPAIAEKVKAGEMTMPKAKKEVKKQKAKQADTEARQQGGKYLVDGCNVIIGDAKAMDLSAFGKYGVIIADPPWPYRVTKGEGTIDEQYEVMSDADLQKIPVGELAMPNSVLILWGTWPKLPEAVGLMKAWGFEYVTGFPWLKTSENGIPAYGVGYWIRGCSEYFLIGKRGNVSPPRQKGFLGLISPNIKHSRKPDSIHVLAEALPGPYLELFARRPVSGWTVFGNDPALTQKVLA